MPKVVQVLAFLMVMQVLCGFWTVAMFGMLGSKAGFLNNPVIRVALAGLCWLTLAVVLLVRPLLSGHPTAWAAVEGILLCGAADSAALLMIAFGSAAESRGILINVWTTAIRGGAQLLLAVLLYRSRGWFGIEPRQGWRTMWKRGWWAILVTGGLSITYLSALAAQASRP